MSELILRFEHMVGRAALKRWPELRRNLQEQLFDEQSEATSRFAITSQFTYTTVILAQRIGQNLPLSSSACRRRIRVSP
jgi:hypothetical protein